MMTGSVWRETTARSPHPALAGDIETDVLVIGGGMCGILTARLLQEAGVRCIVAEAKQVGGGVTQNTTAKLTAQHGLVYADFIQRFGVEKARQYYDANTWAIGIYQTLSEQFPCDFEQKTAYVYSVDSRAKLDREAAAYQKLGLPADIAETPSLPLNTAGAVYMEGQAQFHPLKLLYALADRLEVYENTFVRKIEGTTARTAQGSIKAQRIILATHYPLVNIPGLYFLKLYQHRSYVTAITGATAIDGMYVDEKESGLSFRTYDNLLLVGGGDHKTGKQGGGYAVLDTFIQQAYPQAIPAYRWATQDCMTLDSTPYIGQHRRGAGKLYVGTGFNKWGMTGSMVAAKVLSDMILHGQSEWEELYSPQRSMWTRQLLANVGAAVVGLCSIGGPRCAHMGCKLHYNAAEASWDCACHGSRFDSGGHVVQNPAKRGIRS
ncbi:MAG: FAD-dependent oxidoreductase [Oscillospiraceae bacterium]|nr:FAD-dependent oxidoreductase [Oscillospiraceae bacterium]